MPITTEPDLTIPSHKRNVESFVWERLNVLELSTQEQKWLLKHLEESPAKALKDWDRSVPHTPEEGHKVNSINPWVVAHPGVKPKAMHRLLGRIRDVQESSPDRFGYYKRLPQISPLINEKPGEEFRGYDAIRACLKDGMKYMLRYSEFNEKSPDISRHPTLFTKDARNRLARQGVGSDQGIVRAFTCWILHEMSAEIDPIWANAAATDAVPVSDDISAQKVEGVGADYRLIEGPNYYECPIEGCNKRCEFNDDDAGDKKKQYYNMQKHMMMAKKKVDDHREAKTVIFG